MTWDDANRFIAEMNSGQRPNMGYADWRLPTVVELRAFLGGFIVDRWTTNEPFKNLIGTAYWSSAQGRRKRLTDDGSPEAVEGPLDYAWAVDTDGMAFPQSKSATRRLWPVRGVTVAAPRR